MYMSVFNRKLSPLLVLFALAGAAAAQEPALDASSGVTFTFDSFSWNARAERMQFRNGVIQSGDLRVTADSGSYADNKDWQLEGNVVLESSDLSVRGDTLAGDYFFGTFEMTGDPIRFEGTTESGQAVRGEAERFRYDRASNEVALLGRAWITAGRLEMRGCDIRYGMLEGDLHSGDECDEPFEVRALPEGAANANGETAPATGAGDSGGSGGSGGLGDAGDAGTSGDAGDAGDASSSP